MAHFYAATATGLGFSSAMLKFSIASSKVSSSLSSSSVSSSSLAEASSSSSDGSSSKSSFGAVSASLDSEQQGATATYWIKDDPYD